VDRQDGSKYWCGYQGDFSSLVSFKPCRDYLSEYYIRCEVFDWFGTGRQDLVALSREGGIHVYRNTGNRDRAGLPELELAVKIPLPESLPYTQYCNLRDTYWTIQRASA